jgi:hypothetical protein
MHNKGIVAEGVILKTNMKHHVERHVERHSVERSGVALTVQGALQ